MQINCHSQRCDTNDQQVSVKSAVSMSQCAADSKEVVRVFICAPRNVEGRKKNNFRRFADPKSTLSATPFHNGREIGKSKTTRMWANA